MSRRGEEFLERLAACFRHSNHGLKRRKLPHQVRKGTGTFDPAADTIKVLTMHACKGLEFPVVALPGVGLMPGEGEDVQEEARLFYVAATRVTHKLNVTISGDAEFGLRLLGEKPVAALPARDA